MRDITEDYITGYPSNQNILDLFHGEWSSKLPDFMNLSTSPGHACLFEDARIEWVDQISGGFDGQKILELGPLEAGHTYQIEKLGATSIIAIEANKRAFLKCLCMKEILDLQRAKFLLGDFNKYLSNPNLDFDIIVASGVLYHMKEPLQLIDRLCQNGQQIFIWSHYYDQKLIGRKKVLKGHFSDKKYLVDGIEHSKYFYGGGLQWNGFCGGGYDHSFWISLESIKERFRRNGFSDIHENFHNIDHPNGPSVGLFCRRAD